MWHSHFLNDTSGFCLISGTPCQPRAVDLMLKFESLFMACCVTHSGTVQNCALQAVACSLPPLLLVQLMLAFLQAAADVFQSSIVPASEQRNAGKAHSNSMSERLVGWQQTSIAAGLSRSLVWAW